MDEPDAYAENPAPGYWVNEPRWRIRGLQITGVDGATDVRHEAHRILQFSRPGRRGRFGATCH